MIYRQVGQSGVKVSAVTMGAWAIGDWLWGGSDDRQAVAAIHKALDVGMTSIDTAPVYGFGHSEQIVGQAVAGRRDEVQLLTKYCLRWDKAEGEFYFESKDNQGRPVRIYKNARPDSVLWECEQSLKRLGTDYIDLYQCHWRDPTTPVAETAGVVARLIQQGKVRAAGVSNFTPQEIEEFRRVCPLASDQPPYSMVRRDIEKDVLPHCRANGIGVIVYSPLQLGLLSGKVTMDREFPPDDLRSSSPYFRPENRRRVLEFMEQLRPIAQAHKAALAQLVINWTIHRPGITAALVGARNPQQAQENAAAADIALSPQEMARIDGLVDGLNLEL
jgi:aryl-alcohol dehydrogenase-like predicted oxidoreductase